MSSSARLRLPAMTAVAAVIVAAFAIASAHVQAAPDGENGRFRFSPTSDGGVLRLDTRTGSISNCSKREAGGWACYAVPDERDALDAEIGRLQADNDRLKEELRKRDVADEGSKSTAQLPKGDLERNNEGADTGKAETGKGGRIELPLPSDQDIDRMVSFLERAWRRLVDAANRMQRDVQGKI